MNSFVKSYPLREETLIMFEPCASPMFPIAETSEPEPVVGLPNSVKSLAMPTKSFQSVATSLSIVVIRDAAVVVAALAAAAVVVAVTLATSAAAVVVSTGAAAAVLVACPAAQAELQSIPILSQSRAAQSTTLHGGQRCCRDFNHHELTPSFHSCEHAGEDGHGLDLPQPRQCTLRLEASQMLLNNAY